MCLAVLASWLILLVNEPLRAQTVVDVSITAASDDAIQNGDGGVFLTTARLSLGHLPWVGVRFINLNIPPGVNITSAYLEFTAAGDHSAVTNLAIYGEANATALTFADARNNISARSRTSASVAWNNLATWTKGNVYQSPEIRTIVQELVDRDDWTTSSPAVLLLQAANDSGIRLANAFGNDTPGVTKLHIEYTTEEPPVAPDLLFGVGDAYTLYKQEEGRPHILEQWLCNVTLIAAGATQDDFDKEASVNDVAYVSAAVNAADLGTKLTSTPLGVVNEQPDLVDEFGFAGTYALSSQDTLTLLTNSHHATRDFTVGKHTVLTTSQSVMHLTGTLPTELLVLGQWDSGSSLAAIEAGGELFDGSIAPGRRINLPWGSSTFDISTLTTDGQTLLRQSIEWAAGLVGHWKLDELTGTTAKDSSINVNHGTLGGGSTFDNDSVSPAQVETALRFDGNDDNVAISNDASLQLSKALSITAWVKGSSWDRGGGGDVNTILRKGNSDPTNYQLAIAGGRLTFYLDDSDSLGIQGSTVLSTRQWHHVAATWDGTTALLYVDGVLDNSPGSTLVAPIGTDSRALYLGGQSGGDYFTGTLDDVRLYNHALGADEIAQIEGIGKLDGVRVLKWVEIK